MCAHYTLFIDKEELADIVSKAEERLNRINPHFKIAKDDIFPKYIAPVLVPKDDKLEPMPMRWGYPVRQRKKRQTGSTPEYTTAYYQNAKLETIDTVNLWKDSIPRRRCLIPASGFYEWQHLNEKDKQQFIFKPPQGILHIAGKRYHVMLCHGLGDYRKHYLWRDGDEWYVWEVTEDEPA